MKMESQPLPSSISWVDGPVGIRAAEPCGNEGSRALARRAVSAETAPVARGL